MAPCFILLCLILVIQKTNPFLIISMKLKEIDDCIQKIVLIEEGKTLFEKDNSDCFNVNEPASSYRDPLFEPIIYELGQTIEFEIGDLYGECGFEVEIKINNQIINDDQKEMWSCSDCVDNNAIYKTRNFMLNCFNYNRGQEREKKVFHFYFRLYSLKQLNSQIKEYFYVLNKQNYFFISSNDLDNKINLIDLSLKENLYVENGVNKYDIYDFYDKIHYKLFFDEYSNHKGKFFGTENSQLYEKTYYRIFYNKNIRYQLSNEEKNNKGVHLKLKIGIYNNQKTQLLAIEDFNFFICPYDYKFCDLETSLKCLNEGMQKL